MSKQANKYHKRRENPQRESKHNINGVIKQNESLTDTNVGSLALKKKY